MTELAETDKKHQLEHTAYHEAGHALIDFRNDRLLEDCKVSIKPKESGALGSVSGVKPDENWQLLIRKVKEYEGAYDVKKALKDLTISGTSLFAGGIGEEQFCLSCPKHVFGGTDGDRNELFESFGLYNELVPMAYRGERDEEDSDNGEFAWVESRMDECWNLAESFFENPRNLFVHNRIAQVLLQDKEIIGLQALREIIEEAETSFE